MINKLNNILYDKRASVLADVNGSITVPDIQSADPCSPPAVSLEVPCSY